MNTIEDFFEQNVREYWIEKGIKKYIEESNPTKGYCHLSYEDCSDGLCNIDFDTIEPGYQFKYNVGDVVTLTNRPNSIYIVLMLPALDRRIYIEKTTYISDIIQYGNSYVLLGIQDGKVSGDFKCSDFDVELLPLDMNYKLVGEVPAPDLKRIRNGTFLDFVQKISYLAGNNYEDAIAPLYQFIMDNISIIESDVYGDTNKALYEKYIVDFIEKRRVEG